MRFCTLRFLLSWCLSRIKTGYLSETYFELLSQVINFPNVSFRGSDLHFKYLILKSLTTMHLFYGLLVYVQHVRRAAVLALSTAAHNKPNLIKGLLPELLPLLYDQTVIKVCTPVWFTYHRYWNPPMLWDAFLLDKCLRTQPAYFSIIGSIVVANILVFLSLCFIIRGEKGDILYNGCDLKLPPFTNIIIKFLLKVLSRTFWLKFSSIWMTLRSHQIIWILDVVCL